MCPNVVKNTIQNSLKWRVIEKVMSPMEAQAMCAYANLSRTQQRAIRRAFRHQYGFNFWPNEKAQWGAIGSNSSEEQFTAGTFKETDSARPSMYYHRDLNQILELM